MRMPSSCVRWVTLGEEDVSEKRENGGWRIVGSEWRLWRERGGGMLHCGFCGEGEGHENTWGFVCGSGDVDGGGRCGGSGGGLSGKCGTGPEASSESGERDCGNGSGAIRGRHGSSGRIECRRGIQF